MTEQNGARLAADILKERGPGVVFGYPGAAVLELFDALVRSGLRVVVPAHEQGGIFAADGFARMTGRAGVVAATSGPGATNLVTGLANAFMDSVPLVAVTGNVPSDLIGRDSFQEVYVAGITVPVTKHNFVVRRPEELEEILLSAFDIAESGRPGPVLVDIPRDVSAAPNARKGVSFPARPLPFPTEGELEAAAERINAARRPLVLAGGGVCRSGAGAALEAFLKAGALPCAHTLMAEGLLGEGPLNLGLCGVYGTPAAGRAMRECDLLIAVGTRFSDRVVPDRSLFEGRAVLHLDVDEAEINKNVRADGLLGEAGALLAALTPRLCPHPAWTAPDPPGEEDFPLAAVRLIAVRGLEVSQHALNVAQRTNKSIAQISLADTVKAVYTVTAHVAEENLVSRLIVAIGGDISVFVGSLVGGIVLIVEFRILHGLGNSDLEHSGAGTLGVARSESHLHLKAVAEVDPLVQPSISGKP